MSRRTIARTARTVCLLALLAQPCLLLGGQTGKIAGRILSAGDNEPLVGANVIIQGTYLGAATDIDGFYTINNIQPGTYTVAVTFVGYRKYSVTNVQVRIDLTTRVDAKLVSEAIQTDEIVVRAERPIVQKDLTSSSVTVSSEELKMLPTEDVSSIVNLQAGVIAGHFRGGRSDEVAYLVDGVSVTDPFNGSMALQVESGKVPSNSMVPVRCSSAQSFMPTAGASSMKIQGCQKKNVHSSEASPMRMKLPKLKVRPIDRARNTTMMA